MVETHKNAQEFGRVLKQRELVLEAIAIALARVKTSVNSRHVLPKMLERGLAEAEELSTHVETLIKQLKEDIDAD